MKVLKNLKTAFDLSILVLAHTPKRYHMSPLTINDLHGSKMLSNFADNIFALGESRMGRDLRYLKHLKLRNAAVRCDAANVCTLRLGKMPAINPPPTPLLRAKNLSEPPAVAGGCTPATENTEFTKTAFSSPATDNRPLTTDY